MPKFPNQDDKMHNLKVAYFEVEYEEVFHMKELYKAVSEWCEQWGFSSVDGGEKESLYMELVNEKGAKNHHIWWRLERVESRFIKYFLKIDFQTLNMNAIEVMHKGKKAKTNKGDVIFRVEGWVMVDYNEEWKKHPILKYFEKWYITRFYKKDIEAHKKELWFEVYNLEDTIKQYLTLNTPNDRPVSFHPVKGLP